jgi:hypothetical protein
MWSLKTNMLYTSSTETDVDNLLEISLNPKPGVFFIKANGKDLINYIQLAVKAEKAKQNSLYCLR